MRLFIFVFFLFNSLIYANVSEYVSISKIHISSFENDTIVFDLDFGDKRTNMSSSIRAFGKFYSLNAKELNEFNKIPLINYCVLEKETGLISQEELIQIKRCLNDEKQCKQKSEKNDIKKLYIKCGRGNHESIHLIFDNTGKLDIEIKK